MMAERPRYIIGRRLSLALLSLCRYSLSRASQSSGRPQPFLDRLAVTTVLVLQTAAPRSTAPAELPSPPRREPDRFGVTHAC
jgi:hypothetical protein